MLQGSQTNGASQTAEQNQNFFVSAPTVSLPKGGGVIKGMGEKFGANPVTGTGSMSVPIAISPGRAVFDPQLALSYDAGAGNGPFGFGWNISLPEIARKTDRGLPQYRKAEEPSVFLLLGAEDLVPVSSGDSTHTVDNKTYCIQRYRPRIEGLLARIECWSNQVTSQDTFWLSLRTTPLCSSHYRNPLTLVVVALANKLAEDTAANGRVGNAALCVLAIQGGDILWF